jgi:hypothetical protein
MKTKFLFAGAILFFLLGRNTEDALLFYFFAVHFFTLFFGLFLFKCEKKFQPKETIETLQHSDSSKS